MPFMNSPYPGNPRGAKRPLMVLIFAKSSANKSPSAVPRGELWWLLPSQELSQTLMGWGEIPEATESPGIAQHTLSPQPHKDFLPGAARSPSRRSPLSAMTTKSTFCKTAPWEGARGEPQLQRPKHFCVLSEWNGNGDRTRSGHKV